MKKNIIKYLGILVLVYICIVAVANIYNRWPGGSIQKYYFKDAKNDDIKTVKYEKDEGAFKYLDYTIQLKESLYDEGVHIAYIMLEISKKNGVIKLPTADIYGRVKGNVHIIDNKLSVETDLKYEKISAKYSGNKILLFVKYYYLDDDVDKLKLDIVDSCDGKKIHSYEIKPQNYTKKFFAEDIEIYVSPLGIGIYEKKGILDKEKYSLKYCNEKGEKIDLLKLKNICKYGNGGRYGSDIENGLNETVIFTKNDYLDTKNINNLELNGFELSIDNND